MSDSRRTTAEEAGVLAEMEERSLILGVIATVIALIVAVAIGERLTARRRRLYSDEH